MTQTSTTENDHEVKIRAENVDFYYGKHQTLFDVNLEFRDREVTALIGPSGCGKSTFLRTLSRMNELIGDTSLTGKITNNGNVPKITSRIMRLAGGTGVGVVP